MTEATLASTPVRRDDIARALSRLASVAVLALAASVLVGWWLQHSALQSGIGGLVAMNPATAIAFILCSISLRLLAESSSPPSRRLAQVCAAAVVLLAVLCLSRLFTPWDLGLDRLLFAEQLAEAGGGRPNRMAPNTALNFLLLGTALLFLDQRTKRGWRPAEGLALVAGGFGLFAAAGYVYGSSVLYGVATFIPMAVNTAVGFLILSAGVLCARPGRGLPALLLGPGAGAVLARRILPAALTVPLVLGWLRLEGEKLGLYDASGGVSFMVTATTVILAVLVWRCAVELDRSDVARSQAERTLRDLNERLEVRVAERTEKLERLNDELRALFDASPLAICSLTRDGRVRSWNRAAEQLFGWTLDEVIGRPLPNVPADLRNEFQALRDRVLAGNPFTNHETRRTRKDGQQLDVSISTAPLHDAPGATSGLVVVYMDISGRKSLESQLRQAQKMEAVGRLAGGVAHDFNNMLTVIQTSAEFLLLDLEVTDPRRGDAAEIRDTAERAARLTRQLLAFSRQQVLQPQVVDLSSVVADMEPMLRRVVEENIIVETRLSAELDRVRADRSQLEQVMLNLVVNARDAMPAGGRLLIETANAMLDGEYPRSHLNAKPGPHVALTVTDTGCGMNAATQARIFEPFFTTKALGHGTGLGLATVYGIVQQSGGHIWVYSELGRGTSFKVYFPRYTGPDDEQTPQDSRPEVEDHTTGATILVVEDDVAVRSSIRRVLDRHGYRVFESPTGGHAITAVTDPTLTIDLVISDMVMPEMSGLELRQRLSATRPSLPLLLMSGYSQEAITRLGNHGSPGPIIEKPFTVQGLLGKVREVLGQMRSD
jgi:two-component system, cell cycle sensor histidine kinase and response regulator CckA